jgi:hypothetical protein
MKNIEKGGADLPYHTKSATSPVSTTGNNNNTALFEYSQYETAQVDNIKVTQQRPNDNAGNEWSYESGPRLSLLAQKAIIIALSMAENTGKGLL